MDLAGNRIDRFGGFSTQSVHVTSILQSRECLLCRSHPHKNLGQILARTALFGGCVETLLLLERADIFVGFDILSWYHFLGRFDGLWG